MANSKGYLGRPSYRFLSEHTDISTINMASDSAFEFHESDLYNSVVDPDDQTHGSRMANKPSSSKLAVGTPSSLPVNIPDWSKILGNEYRRNRRRDQDDVEEGWDRGVNMVPPHEFLANARMASLSVQEGVGRTLKGRDLSKVRNSIWAKTGFQD